MNQRLYDEGYKIAKANHGTDDEAWLEYSAAAHVWYASPSKESWEFAHKKLLDWKATKGINGERVH